MRYQMIQALLATGLAAVVTAQDAQPQATPAESAAAPSPAAAPAMDPATMKKDSSFALGYKTGNNFAQQFGRFGVTASDLESEAFMKGFMMGLEGTQPDEAMQKQFQAAMQGLAEALQHREKKQAEANLAEGTKFLEENGKREGVTTTKSGLQYEVLNKGGEEKYVAPKEGAQDNKQFLVNYKGTLINGKQFDASPEGQPVPMTLQVVDGFKEALTTMPVGAKWKLFLPAKLGYGDKRISPEIGPNTTLIFEVELVKIQDAPAPDAGGMPFPMPQGGGGGE